MVDVTYLKENPDDIYEFQDRGWGCGVYKVTITRLITEPVVVIDVATIDGTMDIPNIDLEDLQVIS